MNVWLAIVGVVIVVVLGVFGLISGEVDRALDDPEEDIERRKKEEARKKAWKDKLR
jgi:hypothetical protein